MKKIFLSLLGLVSLCAAYAQLSIGINANYNKYGGDLNRSAPGVGVRAAYDADRFGAVLSFTNGFAITENGTVQVTNMSIPDSKNVAMKEKLTFRSVTLMGNRTLIGNEETMGKFYIGFGASFVFANYKQTITERYDNTYTAPEMESGAENGFTLNGQLGGEFKIGTPSLFFEGGFAIPANQVNNTFVYNAIPAHFAFNVGVKIPLGSDNDY